MYIQSFKRYEKKYLLTEEQYEALMKGAEGVILPDSYGLHTIRNIYLDTDDFTLIRRSLEKPVYKEKLRIRSYGSPDEGVPVFFEIKKKYDGVVYKRRVSMDKETIHRYIDDGITPDCFTGAEEQIMHEIEYLMNRLSPMPKVYLAYDRRAYYGAEDADFRVTFDMNIRSRTNDLTLSDDTADLLDTGVENYRLMEIKTKGAMPIEMTRLLSELKIYPVSFSKYGQVYVNLLSERKIQKCSPASSQI